MLVFIINALEMMYISAIKYSIFQINISNIKGELANSLPLPQHTNIRTKFVDYFILYVIAYKNKWCRG